MVVVVVVVVDIVVIIGAGGGTYSGMVVSLVCNGASVADMTVICPRV